MVHAISLTIPPPIYGMWKKSLLGEEVLVIKKIAEVRTNISISEKINLCVMTEIEESVRIFGKIL